MNRKKFMTLEEAAKILKGEFGDLNDYVKDQAIRDYLGIDTPLKKARSIWFADAIKTLKKSEGFEILKGRLKHKSRTEFREALSILEIAYKFASSGFSVSFIREISSSKTPDMQLHIGGSDLNLEVTQMFSSQFEDELERLRNEILAKVTKLGTCFAGVITIPVDKYNDTEFIKSIKLSILEQLDKNLEAMELDHKFHSFNISRIIDFAMSPKVSDSDFRCIDYELFESWINNKNKELGEKTTLTIGSILYYYPQRGGFLDKLINNITAQKKAQLSFQNKMGVLAVVNRYVNVMGLCHNDEAEICSFLEKLEERIESIPEIGILIFYDQFSGSVKNEVVKGNGGIFICKPYALSLEKISMAEESAIIFNKKIIEKLPEAMTIIKAIVNAFEK